MDSDQEMADMQTRIAFQEQAMEEMNDVLTRQQDMIDALYRELNNIREMLASDSSTKEAVDEKPPHY